MERGTSLLTLISGWKRSPGAGHSFKNYLVELADGKAPGSEHFERRFAEASARQADRIFGGEHDPTEVLKMFREGREP